MSQRGHAVGLRFSVDDAGTPGVSAPNAIAALYGLGVLHGRYRPLQSLLLPAAGQGRLSGTIFPIGPLLRLDAIAARLNLRERGERAAEHLSEWAGDRLDAYLQGLKQGVAEGGQPLELRALFTKLPLPDRAALISGFIMSAYLGLAEGQERMERALIEALAAGADPELLAFAFHPHLEGWAPQKAQDSLRKCGLGFAAHGLYAASGSNAWAVSGERSASGHPLFAADPHLQINQLPALFFEVRIRVGDDYWLGATIPGLPGIAVGRNRNVAWSGTFAVADNVDFHIETLQRGFSRAPEGHMSRVKHREVEIARRFRAPLKLTFYDTDRGVLEAPPKDGEQLSVAWAGANGAGEAIEAYLQLPLAKSAEEAERALERAHTLSLHFVLADRFGDVRYCQVGRIPKRSGGWSGLYPVPVGGDKSWEGFYSGQHLPRSAATNGMVATANEARPAPDGGCLSTLAQPGYRLDRIRQLLAARTNHTPQDFMRMQHDVYSLQAVQLLPVLLDALPQGPLKRALASWDHRFSGDSSGAHAFSIAYRFALYGLSSRLGRRWFERMLDGSELSVWWCAALDRLLLEQRMQPSIRASLRRVAHCRPERWGDVRKLHLRNMILGGLPGVLGLDRGPYPLAGSIGTICQGNLLNLGGQEVAVGPAYRFVCDLSEDFAMSSIPGGIGGSPRSKTYAIWLHEHLAGRYHTLYPPAP